MDVYVQLVVLGLTDGAIYGLLALGLVVIYRVSKVLNFAGVGIGAVSAYLLYDLMKGSGGSTVRFLAAFVAGAALAAVLGIAVERLAIRPLRQAPAAAALAAIAGVLLLAQAVVTMRYGGKAVSIENPLPRDPFPIGRYLGGEGLEAVVVTSGGALILAVLVVLGIALSVLVSRTRWGLAVRAISEDVESAAGLGVRTGRVSMGAWALGSAVGAVASMLFATTNLLFPGNLALVQIKAVVVALFARLSDLRLCLVGGPLLGVIEALLKREGPAGLDQSIAFYVLIAVLLARSRTLAVEARA